MCWWHFLQMSSTAKEGHQPPQARCWSACTRYSFPPVTWAAFWGHSCPLRASKMHNLQLSTLQLRMPQAPSCENLILSKFSFRNGATARHTATTGRVDVILTWSRSLPLSVNKPVLMSHKSKIMGITPIFHLHHFPTCKSSVLATNDEFIIAEAIV